MSSQALEKILSSVPTIGHGKMYAAIDQYVRGTMHLYSFDPDKPLRPTLILHPLGKLGSAWGVLQKPDYLNGGIKRYRKPEWDHQNGYHMNYETLIPGIKEPITNIHINNG